MLFTTITSIFYQIFLIKIKLLNVLKEVESIEKKYIYNNFHGVVPNKAFKKVVYFHTSYHLYQFGVYDS